MGDNRPAPELRDCARLPSPPRCNPIARSQTGTLTLPRAGSGAQSLRKASALESSVGETNENRRWTGVLSHQAAGRGSPWRGRRGLPPAGRCETRPVPGRLPRPLTRRLSGPVPAPVPIQSRSRSQSWRAGGLVGNARTWGTAAGSRKEAAFGVLCVGKAFFKPWLTVHQHQNHRGLCGRNESWAPPGPTKCGFPAAGPQVPAPTGEQEPGWRHRARRPGSVREGPAAWTQRHGEAAGRSSAERPALGSLRRDAAQSELGHRARGECIPAWKSNCT